MDYKMLPQDATTYENEVRNYVKAILPSSLSAGVDMDPAREHTNLMLLQKLLANPELREEIEERIISYGIKFSMVAYKTNLPSDLRMTVFMTKIYSFLSSYQVSLLADYFNKQIEAEKEQKHSR